VSLFSGVVDLDEGYAVFSSLTAIIANVVDVMRENVWRFA
jgi:hypothetical protein